MKKIALITGASSGIGRELAIIHAKSGGDLVIVARRKKKLEELKKELVKDFQCNVEIITKDLSQINAAKEVYDEVKKAKINVDYLINNAGFGGKGIFHERKWQQDLEMIQLNIITLTALTRFFLDDFVKRNSGKILNVSSIASLIPGPMQAVYFATKAFVTSFSNAISWELKDTNITVTALLPGATETEFAKVAKMEKVKGFIKAFSAVKVAKDGYDAMLKGKLNKISGISFGQKLTMATVPFTPKKMLLDYVYKMQQDK